VTVLLLTCSYLGQEFIRVGYYGTRIYSSWLLWDKNLFDDEHLREEPPPRVLIDRVQRNILADKPRVTKFPINFHPENNEHGEEPPPLAEHATENNEIGEEPLPSPDHPSGGQ
jgi:histone chaperone ASF1